MEKAGASAPASGSAAQTGVISCKDLWMVFGDEAQQKLAQAKAAAPKASDAEIAQLLREQDLIPAVRGVSFDLKAGELFVIMGLSGSGKSTLVRCLSKLIEFTAGAVEIDGEDLMQVSDARLIELRRKKMGMVFQHFGLFPHMTVADNVAFPLKVQGVDSKSRRSRALEMISLVGLEGREDAYPRELSGGQRQRVGIARSLAVNPEIWFLDEPFSALDPLIRRQLQDEFLRIQETLQKSIIFITHDIGEALRLADRIAIMRDGRVVQIGTPAEILLNPADDYVAQFTRDIPRGRLMRLEAVMEAAEGAEVEEGQFGAAPRLSTAMSLDDAMSACAASYSRFPVTDEAGKIIGYVTPHALAKAMGAVAE